MPASRHAAATIRLPRSWPSRPILVTSTRGRKSSSSVMSGSRRSSRQAAQARLQHADEAARDLLGRRAAAGAVPGLAPVERADAASGAASCGRSGAPAAAPRRGGQEALLVRVAQGDQLGRGGGRVARADADHDLRVVGLVEQRHEVGDARRLEPLPGIVERRDRGVDRGADPLDTFLVDRGEERLLGREVAVAASRAACRPARRSRAPTPPRSRAARTPARLRRGGAAAGSTRAGREAPGAAARRRTVATARASHARN